MNMGFKVVAVVACAALPVLALGAEGGKQPMLEIRTVPRVAFSPVNVLIIAELRGGDDAEELYCPEIEWDFDDGTKSVHEADCPPYEAGAAIERRYSIEHFYRRAGNYEIKVTLRRNARTLKKATGRLNVRPGASDPTDVRDF
jgi:hypothetical protein